LSITATSRTSAASRSLPSKATTARSAIARRWPRARPAATRSGGAVEAASDDDALRQLPFYVAQRSTVTQVTEVEIP
jgi:hypothetical protein